MDAIRRIWTLPVWLYPVTAVVLGLAIVGGVLWTTRQVEPAVRLTTPYQAVMLAGGHVYYGRLEGYGVKPFPVLRDVHYVQTGTDPKTKEVKNILLKRGLEWHRPDHMILSATQIVLVEPVSPQSKVAELIAALKMQ